MRFSERRDRAAVAINARACLAAIALDLKTLAPGFEIMAEEAAPLINHAVGMERLLIDKLNLLRNWDPSTDKEETVKQ
jgi:hypothetical protein